MSVKRTGTEIGGIAAGSALRYTSATKPAEQVNANRAAATTRLPLLPARGDTWAICFLFAVNRKLQLYPGMALRLNRQSESMGARRWLAQSEALRPPRIGNLPRAEHRSAPAAVSRSLERVARTSAYGVRGSFLVGADFDGLLLLIKTKIGQIFHRDFVG
jgi:hypothetical protein